MKILKAKPVFSIALLCTMGLVSALPAPVASFDFGATDADATVNSPTGSVDGTSFIKVNAVATVTGITTDGFGTLNLEARRGNNTESELFVRWTNTATTVNTATPPVGSILAESPGVYGDYVRQGDTGRTMGLRLNGLVAGEYEIFATVTAPGAQVGRNTAIGVYTGTMPTDTLISDLSQTSVASWDNFNAGLASWTPSTSGSSDWNVLRGVVTISDTSDWVVLHLENGTSGGQMGFSSMQIVAIPEPGTLLLVGIALGSLLFFRRRR